MTLEQWRDVKGYEGYYKVSNLGEIRSLDRIIKSKNGVTRFKKGRVLKQGKQRYCTVALVKYSNSQKTHKVHRLVAQAFLPNPKNKLCVNHIDFNKHNNNVSNLEWTTHQENYKHAVDNGVINSLNPKKQVKLILNDKEYNFESQMKASLFLGKNVKYMGMMMHLGYEYVNGKNGKKYKVIY